MAAKILDGRALAKEIREEVASEIESFREARGYVPAVAIVRVGDDPASVSYARMIQKNFEGAGMGFTLHALPEWASESQIIARVVELNREALVHGIMIQEPLPGRMDPAQVRAALAAEKDIDGVSPINAGRLALAAPLGRPAGVQDYFVPATPLGGMELLKRAGIAIEGKHAVVVGRSNIVGKPMAFLLMQHQATVTICHSRTANLPGVCREADIVCAAVGQAEIIKRDWVKPGAAVVDFGVNFVEGRMTGDVDFESVAEVAGYITPVPGGTGPMTNAMLMKNVIEAARRQVRGRA